MSSPEHRRHGGYGRRMGQKEAELGEPALDLLDEYWFFSNTLVKNAGGARPPMLPKSPSTSGKGKGGGGGTQAGVSRFYESGCRRLLLRTPSLPSRRVGMEMSFAKDDEIVEEEEEEGGGVDERAAEEAVEDDDLNWSSIYEGVLRTRIAEGGSAGGSGGRPALQKAPSMPMPSSVTATDDDDDGRGGETAATTKSTPSMPRLRHSYSTLGRHCRSHTPTKADRTPRTSGSGGERDHPRREVRLFSANQQPGIDGGGGRRKSAFEDKKWQSSSDLESIEVQGFKDLGFVFDQEELRESLADVLPGLRDKTTTSGSRSGSGSDIDDAQAQGQASVVRRPYLSEAWQHAQPASTAIRLRQADARSAAEMKDKIRMWAQAVACNVRQEC